MSAKTDVSGILKRISEPLREKFPEIANNISKLSDDREFQNIIGRMGIVGGLFNMGIYLYKTIRENLKSDEEKYFAALMILMFKSAKESLNSVSSEIESLAIGEIRSEEYIRELFVLFTENLNWKSDYLPDHPAVFNFRRHIIQILAVNERHKQAKYFVPRFNYLIQKHSDDDPILVRFKTKLTTNLIQENLLEYLEEIMSLWEQPNEIDNKALSYYYIENRAYELPITNWRKNYLSAPTKLPDWKVKEFLRSGYEKVVVGAPFGIGKTSLSKKIAVDYARKYLVGEDTWIPIFVQLKNRLENVYKDWNLKKIVDELILPQSEKKILLILDGLDELTEFSRDIEKLLEDVNNIFEHVTYRTIITTRLEAGVPKKLGINKFVRLFPFTKSQVDEFFSDNKYDLRIDKTESDIRQPIQKHATIKFQDLEKFGMEKEEILTPLFCWMFAIVYRNHLIKIEQSSTHISRTLLYISFIQSIILGKYKNLKSEEDRVTEDNPIPERYVKFEKYEKRVLRRIAALKTAYGEELYLDTIKDDLKKIIESKTEQENTILSDDSASQIKDFERDFLNPILTAYFDTSAEIDKTTVEFMHKSFQEYLLAEFYLEAIQNESSWLRMAVPNTETLQFLKGIVEIISDNTVFQNNKEVLTTFINSLGKKDVDELRRNILDNSRNILEDEKEMSTTKVIPRYAPSDLLMIHKWISLFVLTCFKSNNIVNKNQIQKLLVSTSNLIPSRLKFLSNIDLTNFEFENLKHFEGEDEDENAAYGPPARTATLDNTSLSESVMSNAILAGVRFHRADLSGADLSGADLSGADLSGADLSQANLRGANLSGAKLPKADLSGADLSGADLSNASFSGYTKRHDFFFPWSSVRSGANLSGADLSGAKLPKADLSGTILYKADLSRADLTEANLSRADLTEANMSEANLSRAYLSGEEMPGRFGFFSRKARSISSAGANLTRAHLYGANLSMANLTGAILTDAKLLGADLSKALIINPNFEVNYSINDQNHNHERPFSSFYSAGGFFFDSETTSDSFFCCNGARFDECVLNNQDFANYLKHDGGLNVPQPIKSNEELDERIEQWGHGSR